MKKGHVIHLIKPGKRITPNRMVETYCAIIDVDMYRVTLDRQDFTCKRCVVMEGDAQKKFVQNKNLREAQEG